MRQGHMPCADTVGLRVPGEGAGDPQHRPARGLGYDLRVVPVGTRRCTERFRCRLLGREARGQRRRAAALQLAGCEQPGSQAGRALQRGPEPLDVDDVDPDADDHVARVSRNTRRLRSVFSTYVSYVGQTFVRRGHTSAFSSSESSRATTGMVRPAYFTVARGVFSRLAVQAG